MTVGKDTYAGVRLPKVTFVREEKDNAGVWHVYANPQGRQMRIHAKGPRGRGKPDRAATESSARLAFAGFL